jgi:hypothetical protein
MLIHMSARLYGKLNPLDVKERRTPGSATSEPTLCTDRYHYHDLLTVENPLFWLLI